MGEVEKRVVREEKRRIRENKEKGLEKEEVKCVLELLKDKKAARVDGVPTEAWKYGGEGMVG